MFVRWQTKRRAKPRWGEPLEHETDLLVAALVASERRDGRPRHRLVAYLGSIRVGCAKGEGQHYRQAKFWDRVGAALDRLDLAPDCRAAVEARLAMRVYRPTDDERTQAERGCQAWLAGISAITGGMKSRRRKQPWISPKLFQRIARGLAERRIDGETIDQVAYGNRVGPNTVRRVARQLGRLAPGERPGAVDVYELEEFGGDL